MNSDPIEMVIVFRSESESNCRDHSLLLQASGIAHSIRQFAGEWMIHVAAADAQRSQAEFDAYAAENRDIPAPQHAVIEAAKGWIGVTAYIVVLVLGTAFQQRRAFAMDWNRLGDANAELIRQGQWWRAITALTLHSSLEHLAGNVIIGGLVGFFTGQLLGSGVAWLSILIGGAAGNLLNAWIRPGWHNSIGASTAVFAALGILAGHAWRIKSSNRIPRMQKWAPLISGVILLGYLGTGGERTDVGAHVLGFACGAGLGALIAQKTSAAWFSPVVQVSCGFAALTILSLAWWLALAARHPFSPPTL
ncbi:MAG: rhomboid family intramembrane serine protease [Planctomycetes bacterium]|nr:rhomboid family intramembrane serine protease [Planctomycetota bacterium]MBI3834814.1 rhomboid family intramembrane serine protease [Planctomycetota bacterium]